MKSSHAIFAVFVLSISACSNGKGSSVRTATAPSTLTNTKLLTIQTLGLDSLENLLSAMQPLLDAHPISGSDDQAPVPAKSYVVCAETTKVEQTHLCIFNNETYMNYALGRASVMIEGGGKIIDHHENFADDGVNEGTLGHDLTGADLRKYADAYAQAQRKGDSLGTVTAEHQPRLAIETDFWQAYVNDRLAEQPDLVLLALSSNGDFKGSLTHEILHARYFKSEAMRTAVQEYTTSSISAADQTSIKTILNGAGYDVLPAADDDAAKQAQKNTLFLNEMQAYLLEPGAATDFLGKPKGASGTDQTIFDKYAAPLRQAIDQAGVEIPVIN